MPDTVSRMTTSFLSDDSMGSNSDKGVSFHPACRTSSLPHGEVPDGVLYQGFMEKYSIGRSSLLGVKNWKRRFFVIGSYGPYARLEYYKDGREGRPLGAACGDLQLDRHTTRIVTHPSTLTHEKAGPIGQNICIIFYDRETGREFRLLLRMESREDHIQLSQVLTSIFSKVDLPSDYSC
eukprot:CAMPEP_0176454810 /NCGR_PEP_ID=MMETSP0127-20121128/30215_1 /TAXON_ID=938130 /ORGANISM="Platyophrya macrostoma, Strain WH" /LENGTH=178 /DNA_ID=CAMNT_0017844251 /DNA_START=69 /DNA_END=605 /DNA_ORIENTATION=+